MANQMILNKLPTANPIKVVICDAVVLFISLLNTCRAHASILSQISKVMSQIAARQLRWTGLKHTPMHIRNTYYVSTVMSLEYLFRLCGKVRVIQIHTYTFLYGIHTHTTPSTCQLLLVSLTTNWQSGACDSQL